MLLCLSLYLGNSLIGLFADKDRDGEPHRACNGIPSGFSRSNSHHYLSVHGSRLQDDDLTTLLICFYLSRFCSVLIVSNKNNLITDTFLLIFRPRH